MYNNCPGAANMADKIIRLPQLLDRTGDSRSGAYDKIAKGLLPKQVPIGVRSVGWSENGVNAVIDARIARKSDAEIRELVARINATDKHLPESSRIAVPTHKNNAILGESL
jgi:prophage regulatory protein